MIRIFTPIILQKRRKLNKNYDDRFMINETNYSKAELLKGKFHNELLVKMRSISL